MMIKTIKEYRISQLIDVKVWAEIAPSRPPRRLTLQRVRRFARHTRPAPRSRVLRTVKHRPSGALSTDRWALYFIYTPDGRQYEQHAYTLDKLREYGFSVLLVCATTASDEIILNNFNQADAIISKSLDGFDFSGYSVGLWHLTRQLGAVDVLVMNDSVFGPFVNPATIFDRTPWFLTGFTANAIVEPHIQSYAFALRGLTAGKLAAMRSVFWRWLAHDDHWSVVFLQETRFARVASRIGPVGAMFYQHQQRPYDLTITDPLVLLEGGLPFIKRGLLGKLTSLNLCDPNEIRLSLEQRGHPSTGSNLFYGAGE